MPSAAEPSVQCHNDLLHRLVIYEPPPVRVAKLLRMPRIERERGVLASAKYDDASPGA